METFATFLSVLGRASLQGAIAIAAVWAVCRLFPRLPASLRCGLWWLACLKLLVSLIWISPVPVPVLPAPETVIEQRGSSQGTLTPWPPLPSPGEGENLNQGRWRPSPGTGRGDGGEGLATALLGLWGAGLLIHLAWTAFQLRSVRAVVRRSEPVSEPWIEGLFEDLRERLGVSGAELRVSSEVMTPQVLGLVRPVVLLPASGIARLSRTDLAMSLCHELLHLRRGDLWLGWVPALAQRLFFFHPLAALAAREYALAREAACDAEVLRILDPAPEAYGRLLLRLGVTPKLPKLAAAGAAPSFQILKRRLEMLQQASEKKRIHRGWWGVVALLALAGLIPFQIVAQENAEEADESIPVVEAVEPVEAIPPVEPVEPVRVASKAGQSRTLPPPPAPPVPAAPPVPPTPPKHARTSSWGHGDSWIVMYGDNHHIMHGSTDDIRAAKKHRNGADIIWFERDGKTYVIRDAATVRAARDLFEPQSRLGEQQAELGEQQAKLGEQQAKLGAEQAKIGIRYAELGAKHAALSAELMRLEDQDRGTEEIEERQRELEEEQRKLENEIGDKQRELSAKQSELGRQQGELGRKQGELGRQQAKLAEEAEKKFDALLDRALANGLAQEVDR
ncbi:MAG TPA: M56 family metallopeptidase [Thermoanaerobaculia bacterium]